MEILLSQRINFAIITPFKDYCIIGKTDKEIESSSTPIYNPESDIFSMYSVSNNLKSHIIPSKNSKRKTVFFYSDNPNGISINLESASRKKPHFYSTDDNQIKRHYGRPFSSICVKTIIREIVLDGDKIKVKIYTYDKNRNVNSIYFKKHKKVVSFSFDLKTGNFKISQNNKNGKNNGSWVRTNNFNKLKEFIFINIFSDNKQIPEKIRKSNSSFNDDEFINKIIQVLNLNIQKKNKTYLKQILLEKIIEKFVETKNIKVPNGNYEYWLTKFYPTEVFLKKNGRKLLASILDVYGLNSKVMVKILHEYPQINFPPLIRFCKLLGVDYQKYVGNINPTVFKNSFRKNNTDDITKYTIMYQNFTLTSKEKENLIKIVNSPSGIKEDIFSERTIILFEDHFRMLENIRQYKPDFTIHAQDMDSFMGEHDLLTKTLSLIKKGYVTEYVYDEKTLSSIQEKVKLESEYVDDGYLYPKVLTREEEYEEEGKFMHHCVATYSDKGVSMIVSIRTEDNKDRVTCEYDIQSGDLIQSRHFCNQIPPPQFVEVIDVLNKKIKQMARWGTLNWKEKRKVPIMVDGVEIDKKLIGPIRVTDIFPGLRLPF